MTNSERCSEVSEEMDIIDGGCGRVVSGLERVALLKLEAYVDALLKSVKVELEKMK